MQPMAKKYIRFSMKTGKESYVDKFPTPEELWNIVYSGQNEWKDRFAAISFEDVGGTKILRYYQEIAVNNVLDAIAEKKQRILLTLATGTGKTLIAAEISWKLFNSRWNLNRDGIRRPEFILADRIFLQIKLLVKIFHFFPKIQKFVLIL